jgi:Holliday junction resolvasome RuvABC endonuclease subunit
MGYSKVQVQETITSKGFSIVDIEAYKNMNSELQLQCGNQHTFVADFASIRRENFSCPLCEGAATSAFEVDHSVPKKNGYRIIAIDQSSNKLGISFFDNGKLTYYHLVEVTGAATIRLLKIYKFLIDVVIKQWQPNYLIFEDIYQDNPKTYKMLSMVLGICILAAEQFGIEHSEILNKTWQSEFNIKGSNRQTQKDEVMKLVKEMYNLSVNDDIADAIMMGKYASKKLSDRWEPRHF